VSGTPEEDAQGGPAFPTDYHAECSECKSVVYGATSHGGMTLRDYFAGKALQGMMAYPGQEGNGSYHSNSTPDTTAKTAYAMADAMIAARSLESKDSRNA